MSLAGTAGHIFAVRFVDRIGKGIRGAPRDALLATLATATTRGRVFGFHRGMDHAGAILGPILASLFLVWQPGHYRTLFALAVIPAAIAVLLILLVQEPPPQQVALAAAEATEPLDSPVASPRELRAFLCVVALFTVGNSTDAYLLLRLTEAAGSAEMVPLMWAGLHVVKASASFVAPGWSDRVGRRPVIGLGWVVYALVYLGFAVSTSLAALLAWFLVYGIYFGCAEGTEKALVADLAPPSVRGTAFGVYTAVQSLGVLIASLLFGVLWTFSGPRVAFLVGAALAILATGALFALVSEPARRADRLVEPANP
jgi:MFS family permease